MTSYDVSGAISSKCFTLIEKTRKRILRLDQHDFPTLSTKRAQELFLKCLDALSEPKNLSPMDRAVLYNRLINLQQFANDIEESTVNKISWPLVSHCDRLWEAFFGQNGPKIFYSVTNEHNYIFSRFSDLINSNLEPLLSQAARKIIFDENGIFLLRLASIEDENLPLYANIGHEFGHAYFQTHARDLLPLLSAHFKDLLISYQVELVDKDADFAHRRFERIKAIIRAIAEELFSDQFGALLMGPAFLFSLFEISWGDEPSSWPIRLTSRNTIAYPSFNYRLDKIKEWSQIGNLIGFKAQGARSETYSNIVTDLLDLINSHNADGINMQSDEMVDSPVLLELLKREFSKIKSLLDRFLQDTHGYLFSCHGHTFNNLEIQSIYELIQRLENNVLPNIVPDGTLLGVPADFKSLLNASALFRMKVLLDGKDAPIPETYDRVSRVERLTSKALEVSLIQQQFNDRYVRNEG